MNSNINHAMLEKHFPYLFENTLGLNDQCRIHHLDHAASTLYSVHILEKYHEDLKLHLYSNPHSKSPSSKRTAESISNVRNQILNFFGTNASKYSVIFTQNASHACKLFAESFDWNDYSRWRYLLQCHNSQLGMRELIYERGVSDVKGFNSIEDILHELSATQESQTQDSHESNNLNLSDKENSIHYFQHDQVIPSEKNGSYKKAVIAYPLECNSTGQLYPMEWIEIIRNEYRKHGAKDEDIIFFVDAAKNASTSYIDLSVDYSPDFLCVSFYKLFGYPTGVGALLVKNSCKHLLKKVYFSGGTVEVSIADQRFHRFRKEIWEQFEDGTVSFLDIIALGHFLKHTLSEFGYKNMQEVSSHTRYLALKLKNELEKIKHYNGNPVCKFYGWNKEQNHQNHGSIVNLNLLKSDGSYIGYSEVEQIASLHRINLRVGCFCNAGACQKNLNMSSKDVIANYEAGHVCWDRHDLVEGKPTGSVRLSFGYCSVLKDVEKFCQFVKSNFVEQEPPKSTPTTIEKIHRFKVGKLVIYPIKSCLGAQVSVSWPLTDTGMKYDREWVIIDSEGEVLVLKQYIRLGTIQPRIEGNMMILTSTLLQEEQALYIPLDEYPKEVINIPLFGSNTQGLKYPSEVNLWFERILGFPISFIRKDPNMDRISHNQSTINFSNEGQYLCLTRSSLNDIHNKLVSIYGKEVLPSNSDWLIERFRANIILEEMDTYTKPFDEDHFSTIDIGSQSFQVMGTCKRCSMINVDTNRMSRENEPLKTLFTYRKEKGRVIFGILLSRVSLGLGYIQVGELVRCETQTQDFQNSE